MLNTKFIHSYMSETRKDPEIYAEKSPLPEALVWTEQQLKEEKEKDRAYEDFIQRGFSPAEAMAAIKDAIKNQAFLEKELQNERRNAGLDTETIVENLENTIPNRVIPTIEELRQPMDEKTIRERTEYAPIEDLISLTQSAFEENNAFYRKYKRKWNETDPLVRNWKLLRKEVIRRETEETVQKKIAEPIDDNADTPVTAPPDMPETHVPQEQTAMPRILESSLESGTDDISGPETRIPAQRVPVSPLPQRLPEQSPAKELSKPAALPPPEIHTEMPIPIVSGTQIAGDETPYDFDFAKLGDIEAIDLQDELNEAVQEMLGQPTRPKGRVETPLYGTTAVQRDVPVPVIETPKKDDIATAGTEKKPGTEMTGGGTIVYLDKKDPRARALQREIHQETKDRYQKRSDTLTKINKFEAINNMLNDQDELLRDLKKHGSILNKEVRREKQTRAEQDERTVGILLRSLPENHPITNLLEEKRMLLATKRSVLFPTIAQRIAGLFRSEPKIQLSKIEILNQDVRSAIARMKRSLEEPRTDQGSYPAPQKHAA